METCTVDLESLIDYRDGKITGSAAHRLRSHLESGCPDCERRLQELSRLFSAIQKQELVSPPVRALNRARALFRERYREESVLSLVARLLFDSRSNLTPSFARGENSATFQRLYSAGDYEIDLWEERLSETESYLIGQALPHAGGDAILPETLSLIAVNGEILHAEIEEEEFHLPRVPAGTYQMRLRLPEAEILVPEIIIGS